MYVSIEREPCCQGVSLRVGVAIEMKLSSTFITNRGLLVPVRDTRFLTVQILESLLLN